MSSPTLRQSRGYFGIGIYHAKHECNQGTLWRSAFAFGADFCFTIGRRFTPQASDTPQAWRHIPMLNFASVEDLVAHLPHGCPLVGVELHDEAKPLRSFMHPERCCYLLGAEDSGLPPTVMKQCHQVVQIPNLRSCLNVSTTGSLVMYDRSLKRPRGEANGQRMLQLQS